LNDTPRAGSVVFLEEAAHRSAQGRDVVVDA
jgi:hypothetical protein